MPSLSDPRLLAVSSPSAVEKNGRALFGPRFVLFRSAQKTKKYAVRDPAGRLVNFGHIDYEDFTKHKSAARRRNFLARNHKWRTAPPYSPAFLAYHLLW
jgi:hypothetical protein